MISGRWTAVHFTLTSQTHSVCCCLVLLLFSFCVSVTLAAWWTVHWWYGVGLRKRPRSRPLSRDVNREIAGPDTSLVLSAEDREWPWRLQEQVWRKTSVGGVYSNRIIHINDNCVDLANHRCQKACFQVLHRYNQQSRIWKPPNWWLWSTVQF